MDEMKTMNAPELDGLDLESLGDIVDGASPEADIDLDLDLGEFVEQEVSLNQSPEFLQKFAENFSKEFVLLPPAKK